MRQFFSLKGLQDDKAVVHKKKSQVHGYAEHSPDLKPTHYHEDNVKSPRPNRETAVQWAKIYSFFRGALVISTL